MMTLSVGLNFYQEHKASNAAEKLQEKVALVSNVLREGKEQEVRAKDICIGDILVLNAGDLIPADARIIESKDFFVNQSSLTGEAFPIEKSEADPTGKGDDITSLTNILFSGTSVITGTALAVVTATGADTEFGKIATELSTAEQDNNFTLGVKGFSYFILRIVVVFVLFIFAVNALIKHDFLESLTFAIAVAVGLTPEFLPMIMTVTMAKGAVLMAKKGIIVKKLTAIPSFGSMNILCTDKTGTLTEDKITLVEYVDIEGNHSPDVLQLAYINSSMQTGITNPLDQAIINYKKLDIADYKKIDEIPFDFMRRRMSVVVQNKESRLLITKGAPESMLPQSSFIQHNGKLKKIDSKMMALYKKQYEKLSREGYRVLALATREITEKKKIYDTDEEHDLVLSGFAAFLDPVKENARQAIDQLEHIGIEVKVITGDNELVTQKACDEAGIVVKGVLLGSEIVEMSDHALEIAALVNLGDSTVSSLNCLSKEKSRTPLLPINFEKNSNSIELENISAPFEYGIESAPVPATVHPKSPALVTGSCNCDLENFFVDKGMNFHNLLTLS
jgi:Mg2+-importing ATPase